MTNFLLLIGLCLLICACNNGDLTHHRSYVISQSRQPPPGENITEPQPD